MTYNSLLKTIEGYDVIQTSENGKSVVIAKLVKHGKVYRKYVYSDICKAFVYHEIFGCFDSLKTAKAYFKIGGKRNV